MKAKEQDKKLREKVKSLESKEAITFNTAKASLNSLSSKLEQRRQAYKEQRLKAEQ